MKGELRKPASVNAILLIGIFTLVFLGAEYLFVNMISLSVTEGRTVIAQNYALGASAVGFFLYPAMERWGGRRYKSALTFILALGAIICTFIVQQHISYAATMTAGMVLFLLLGVFGSAVHYLAAVTIDGTMHWHGWRGSPTPWEFCSSMQTTTLSTWRLRRRRFFRYSWRL